MLAGWARSELKAVGFAIGVLQTDCRGFERCFPELKSLPYQNHRR